MSPLCHKRTPEPVSFDYRLGPKRPVMQRPSLLEVGRTTRRRRRCFHAILNLRCSDSGMGFVFVATARAADAKRGDNFIVAFDRYAAGQRQHIGD